MPAKYSIFCYPDQPHPTHVLEHVRQVAGWDVATSPETADWCVLYQDATWVRLPDDDPYASISTTWINGRCRDISKRKVELVFEAVFGYPLALDPLTHQGVCLRKSNRNFVYIDGVKDVKLVSCPIAAEDLDEEHVYERLVDSRVPGLGFIDLPTIVVRGEVLSVGRVIRPDWTSAGTFDDTSLDGASVYPASIFSEQELEQIARFCDVMGLDYGKLDIMRDREDQRIYILDANKTVGSGAHPSANRLKEKRLAQAFIERYPPRSANSAAPVVGSTTSRTNGYQDEVVSLAVQVDAQAERIARLEAKVDTLGIGIDGLLDAFSVARQRSRKKKRKK